MDFRTDARYDCSFGSVIHQCHRKNHSSELIQRLRYPGAFYRINYNYKDRYLFEANGRYDGSSKFPKDDRFGFFPSFSVGWNIARESRMEKALDYVSDLKLRASRDRSVTRILVTTAIILPCSRWVTATTG